MKQRSLLGLLLLVLGSSSLALAQQAPAQPPAAAPPSAEAPAVEGEVEGEVAPSGEVTAPSPAEAAAAGQVGAGAEAEPPVAEAPPMEAKPAAPAKAAQGEGEEMIVTGSRIKRSSTFVASAPVEIIDRKQLEYSGATTLADVVQYLTVGQGSGYQGGSGGPGTVSINLRGLGQGATLVLLNGHRLPPSGANIAVHFEDIGTIPLAAIERIEILKGGASAIYGSDAVGGVVNIITRKKFDGARVEVDGQGTTQSFDNRGGTVSGVVGASSERGRVMLSMQYGYTNELDANKRSWTARSNAFVSQQGQPGTYVVGTGLMPDPDCTRAPGSSLVTAASGAKFCGFNIRDYTFLVGAGERANAFANGEYDLTKHTTFFSELLVSRLRGDAISSTSFPVAPPFPQVPANHVDNPFGTNVSLIGRPFGVAQGPERNTADDDTLRGLAGLRGDFEDVGRDTIFESWEWEAFASFGQSRYHNIIQDNLRPQLQQALNSCSDPTHLENCYNPFYSSVTGMGTPNSDAVVNSIKGQSTNLTDHSLATYNAGMSGNLFELPGGDVGIAFGTEIRREWRASDSDHDANNKSYGFIIGNTDALAARNVYSGYLELRWPFYDGIELQTAGRLEHYTDIKETTPSPSVGLTITPAEIAGRDNVGSALRRLQFRGHATSAFRAPTLYQSFPGNVVVPTLVTDPTSPLPLFIPVQAFGTPTLKPERAFAVSGGMLWSPFDELGLTAEFWDYNYTDRIVAENALGIVADWFSKRSPGNCPVDPHIVSIPATSSTASCQIQQIKIKNINSKGSLVTNGIDFGAMINLTGATFGGNKNDWGTIAFGTQGTYTLTYDIPRSELLADAIRDGIKCDGTSPTSACHLAGNRNATSAPPPVPRWRMNFPLIYTNEGHSATVIAHFIDSIKDDQAAATNPGKVVAFPTIKSWTTFDLQYGYTIKDWIGKELTIRLGAYNVFNAIPPTALGGGLNIAGFEPDLYDPRGRMVYAKLISHF